VTGSLQSATGGDRGPLKPALSVVQVVDTFTLYLRRLHDSFDQVKIGDNPEVSAEGPDADIKGLG
jgi:hypothetical protein